MQNPMTKIQKPKIRKRKQRAIGNGQCSKPKVQNTKTKKQERQGNNRQLAADK